MNRHLFLRFVPALPIMALAQLYPPLPTAELMTLDSWAERVTSIESAGIFLGMKLSNVDMRVRALEHCAGNCDVLPPAAGDV